MNYFLLAETEFFRRINEAGDCNMEKAYTAFATQVIELCNGGMDMNLTAVSYTHLDVYKRQELLDAISSFILPPESVSNRLSAYLYKIEHDPKGHKLSLIHI